jgi:thiamine-phosphate pyrophosphorylase
MLRKIMNEHFYKLMLVTNRKDIPLNEYLEFVKICATSGITSVQLREKGANFNFLLEFGQKLKNILDPLGIPLIVNDDIKLALKLDASGVHLGQTDGDHKRARDLCGSDKIIGISIDSKENLMTANDLSITYVGVGAIFETGNKKNIVTLWGLEGLHMLSRQSKHPIIAIGGINEHNIVSVMTAGAKGIAVIGVLHDTNNPRHLAQLLRHIIDNSGKNYAF